MVLIIFRNGETRVESEKVKKPTMSSELLTFGYSYI